MELSDDRRGELFGLLAEFESPAALVHAAERAREAGYVQMEAYTPQPVEELSDALGQGPSKLPWLVLAGGLLGGLGGFGLQWWSSVIAYPLNVGGRPLFSWPAFIPVTFETTILVAALTAVLGMLAMNGLPRPHHPVFGVERFVLASRDRYFLLILARDDEFAPAATREFLLSLEPTGVHDVED